VAGDLEKIDLLRARMGVSYGKAKRALEEAGSDLVQALINLEAENKRAGNKIQNCVLEMAERIRELWAKGSDVRLLLKRDGQTVLQIPAGLAALGLVGAMARSELALLASIGAITALARRYSLDIAWPDRDSQKH
jgi:hypothetical protein